MNLHLAFQTFLTYLDFKREKIAAHRLKEIAKSEKLDNFVGIEDFSGGGIDYFTTHGFRTLNWYRLDETNLLWRKKAMGFL